MADFTWGAPYNPGIIDAPGLSLGTFSVENLDLPELLKNRHVRQLYESQQRHANELLRLTAELAQMTVQRTSDVGSDLSRGSTPLRESTPLTPLLEASSAIRPRQYPAEILWNLADCEDQPDSGWTAANSARPPMRHCIRQADGRLINDVTYRQIRTSARIVKADLTALPIAAGYHGKLRHKAYYRTHHAKKWNDAIARLEVMQPLLALCGNHWKAEQVLGNSLRGTDKKKKKTVSETDDEDDDDEGDSATQGGAGAGVEIQDQSKKRRKDENSTPLRPDVIKKSRAAPMSPLRLPTPAAVRAATSRTLSLLPDPASESDSEENPAHLMLQSASFLQAPTMTLPAGSIDVDFIVVSTKVESLLDTFSELPAVPGARDLLEFLQEAGTTLNKGEPSANVMSFLERIENADPNAADIDEDNTNANWGHRQFTAGGLTCTTVLTLWSAVGNTNIAYRLIAAALRTCKVARHLCFKRQLKPDAFLSDAYLSNIVEQLRKITKVPAPPSSADDVPTSPENDEAIRAALSSLTKDELKQWFETHKIELPKKKNKGDFVSALMDLSAPLKPSQKDIQAVLTERKAKKAK
ncbi:hypothetical protein FA95DRAFT_1625999 [Auriscalpium vulgare]|uniref:Uncharacterized protein n=1 Tax=Auriscalpium vulgare TaxID=40419 RepID=A0ACB8RJ88_9AGAM|nr:hypothetical protein FA95DRAFT_1625999 [Auriscalpium vulgare]